MLGVPANLDEIKKYVKNKIFLIEDTAWGVELNLKTNF